MSDGGGTWRRRLLSDLGFVWQVWLTNWRFWALSPLLLVAGVWVIGTLWSTPADWVERICVATGQDKRAAAWSARNGYVYVDGDAGAAPAVLVAGTALLTFIGAMSVVIGLAGAR